VDECQPLRDGGAVERGVPYVHIRDGGRAVQVDSIKTSLMVAKPILKLPQVSALEARI